MVPRLSAVLVGLLVLLASVVLPSHVYAETVPELAASPAAPGVKATDLKETEVAAPAVVEVALPEEPENWLDQWDLSWHVGWGYLFDPPEWYIPLEPILMEVDPRLAAWAQSLDLFVTRMLNINGELRISYPVADYYTLGVGIQSKFAKELFAAIFNRVRFPISGRRIAIFVDLPVGIGVLGLENDRPVISFDPRVGFLMSSESNLGFSMFFGPEWIFLSHDNTYGSIFSLRFGIGMTLGF